MCGDGGFGGKLVGSKKYLLFQSVLILDTTDAIAKRTVVVAYDGGTAFEEKVIGVVPMNRTAPVVSLFTFVVEITTVVTVVPSQNKL